MRPLLAALCLSFLPACEGPPGTHRPDAPCPPTLLEVDGGCVDSDVLTALLLDDLEADAPSALVQVSGAPYAPTCTGQGSGHVWVTPLPAATGSLHADDIYRSLGLGPDRLPAAFPIGTVIVHAPESPDGTVGVRMKVADQGTETDWHATTWFEGYPTDAPSCTTCHNLSARPDTEGIFGLPAHAR